MPQASDPDDFLDYRQSRGSRQSRSNLYAVLHRPSEPAPLIGGT